jgi:hypothetical protein
MSNIEVIDNFLSNEDFKKIYDLANSSNFPYFMSRDKYTIPVNIFEKNEKDYENLKEYIQFVHSFYNIDISKTNKSDYFFIIENFIKNILDKKKIKKFELLRAKINVQTKLEKNTIHNHNTPHNDFPFEHKVFLFYINDSDGDTFFFNNKQIFKQISPKENRLIIFDGDIEHAGTHPINSDKRIVLNIDGRINE